MSLRILPLTMLAGLVLLAGASEARTATARMARVVTPVAVLEGVELRLEWPQDAAQGTLALRVQRLQADDLGYRYRNLSWNCPLQRAGNGRWRCEGPVRSGGHAPLHLALAVDVASTDARLSSRGSSLVLHRNAAAPDLTRIDLVRVPVAWAQALVGQAWADARLKSGTLEGRLSVHAPVRGPLRVSGPLALSRLSLDTADGRTAAEGVNARATLDYRQFAGQSLIAVEGNLQSGEWLAGNAYFALPATPVAVGVSARRWPDGQWELPQLSWNDGEVLRVQGSLLLDRQLSLRDADLRLDSNDLSPLRPRYLSGWLGLLGLGDLGMQGGLNAHFRMAGGRLQDISAKLHEVNLRDGRDRFRLDGLDGAPVLSAAAVADSELRWQGGQLHGLPFGAAIFPLRSQEGHLGLREPVTVPALGGGLRFDGLNLRMPRDGQGLAFDFGLSLENLDIGRLAVAMDWPAFQGKLNGRIPRARYAEDRLDFDGTLTAHIFDGTVQVSGLSMERPFGTAPTLSADIELDDLNLQSLTGVFGFGEITGALDGHIRELRLVDWSPQSFDADLHSDPHWRGRQRISQRAVQDLSSVGGGDGLGGSLQAQALKLFDDFGYRRIGIRCRLAEEICRMDGLGSAGAGFIIVEGKGLPRLTVVGFNHDVDWPTLVQRLADVTKGESKPVFE